MMEMTLNIPDSEAAKLIKKIREDSKMDKLIDAELSFLASSMSESGYCKDIKKEEIIDVILLNVCEGTRNPDSWQREFVEKIGIIPNDETFLDKRDHYGDDEKNIMVV
ncbi:hypothetical protein [Salinivibrio kushneri]|uniref:hypothetical protein n=1 Tax=Salinivibrio kushneri TaxID=1908198 RepID=UPI0009899C5A|nr:hypothetical protein [Salinivibrio kushneri]OOE63661.1 hypothetical protein BZG19_16070 [Salinivibrio kushneri]